MSEGSRLAEAKKLVLIGFLLTDLVEVWVDVTRQGVVLPNDMKRDFNTRLEFRRDDLARDLQLTNDGIGATICHLGSLIRIFIPWRAVFALSTENGSKAWPDEELIPGDGGYDAPIPKFVANAASSAPVPTKTSPGRAPANSENGDTDGGSIPVFVANVESSAPVVTNTWAEGEELNSAAWRKRDGRHDGLIPKFVGEVESSAPVPATCGPKGEEPCVEVLPKDDGGDNGPVPTFVDPESSVPVRMPDRRHLKLVR